MTTLSRNQVLIGDACTVLRTLPSGSVDCCVTSPPYYRLRNYQMAGQYGLEATVDAWVTHIEKVVVEIARLLTSTGTLWLNLGDSYSARERDGALSKSLLLGPERLALRLITSGWRLRNKLIWAKSNPLPTSVRDRLTCTYEVVYLLTRAQAYYFDLDAIRLPHRSASDKRHAGGPGVLPSAWRGPNADDHRGLARLHAAGRVGHPLGKNPGDVWTLPTANYRGSHYAAMSLRLAERAVRAGCPERRCTRCAAPWRHATLRAVDGTATRTALAPTCDCQSASEPGVVLDPFLGSGTTALAAERLGREWIGVELNPAFVALTRQRLSQQGQVGQVHN